jgi:hypothetical protein
MLKTKILPIICVLTYLTTLILAGHGIMPAGLTLVIGSPFPWATFQSFGYLGIISFVLGVFVCKRASAKDLYMILGCTLLLISWMTALSQSDSPAFQLAFSIHFLIATAILLYTLIKSTKLEALTDPSILIWPLGVTLLVTLIERLSWAIFRASVAEAFFPGKEVYLLISGFKFLSTLLLILFLIGLYINYKKTAKAKQENSPED